MGNDGTSYGSPLPSGTSHKQLLLDELKGQLPLDRLHFCGTVSRPDFLRLLQVSSAHVYFTYPLFLSWSCLEAMSAGCLVIGSDTGPVRDVINDNKNGLLVDFFDTEGLANRLIDALRAPEQWETLRSRARKTVQNDFDVKLKAIPQWMRLIDQL